MHPSSLAPRWRGARRSIVATLVLSASLAATALGAGRAAAASDPHAFADPIFSADARGDIATIGNVTTTCDPTYTNEHWSSSESAAACGGATSGATGLVNFEGKPMPPINNRLSMRYVDVDADPTTFASSTARLDVPAGATVLWAGLHWNAATQVNPADLLYGSDDLTPAAAPAQRFQVRFSTPASGGYVALDAAPADGTNRDTWDDVNPGGTVSYGGFVDVTDLVSAGGSGTYGVADVQSCTGFGGCFGSWSLTVAYAAADLPPRNLNVWHGWQLTTPSVDGGTQEFTVHGITPPPHGPVNARIGVVQADGDRGLGPDSLDISSPSHPAWKTFETIDRPLNPGEGDWFNSTVNAFGQRRSNAAANPNLLANLNQDIALVEDDEVIGNDDDAFSFRIQTASTESLYSQVVHSAVELYAPEIQVDKTVDPAGPVATGDEVTWTIEARNVGIDPIRDAVVTDPLPDGIELVEDSIAVTEGPADEVGPRTATIGDDEVDWSPEDRTLTVRVGAGANETDGGTMAVAPSDDGSDRVVILFRTRVTAPAEALVTNTADAAGLGRELDDPFGPLTTDDDDPAEIALAPLADLGITKSDGDATVRAVGDLFDYELVATNAGPSAATGVLIDDELDARLRFVSSPDGCTADGQVVRCDVGDLGAGEAVTRHLTVEVAELPGPGSTIPNVASITGNEPNPDCDDDHPDALCNHDDEDTPQPAIDLGIVKTDGDAVIHAVGDRYRYRLEVTNAGPDDATEVAIDDDLDDRIRYLTGDERCTAEGQHVTCQLGDLAAGEATAVELEVEVTELPEAGTAIPNVATVAAAESDPDCDDGHPEALCNADDEDTPRAEDPAVTTTTATPTTAAPTHPSADAPQPDPGTIVRTGIDVSLLVGIAIAALGVGIAALAIRRRRRRDYEFW